MRRKAKDNDKLAWAYLRLAANVQFAARVQILDFDRPAIQRYEDLKHSAVKVRKPDRQIAAIALQHHATVVTRNVRDFGSFPGLSSRTGRRNGVEHEVPCEPCVCNRCPIGCA